MPPDAAHAIGPHVGQGASLALEDAFVIAKCLRDTPDVGAAFAMLERRRRARVEPIVRQSRRTGQQTAPRGRLGRVLRDLILPMLLRKSAQSAQGLSVVELESTSRGVRMTLTFDAMHSDEWTQRAVMGWEGELGKLAVVVAARLDTATVRRELAP